ncbi:hypothetical protein ACHAQG_007350 [Verticillium nonalfalfae]
MAQPGRDDNTSGVTLADTNPAAAPGATAAGADEAKAKYPKGIVLGPDGKPCRTCTSSTFWASMGKTPKTKGSATTATAPSATNGLPADCPPDVERLGNSSWTLLHSIAATYPENPSPAQKDDLRGFMRTFSRLYPCWVCAEDFQSYIKKDEVRVEGRQEFGNWLCMAHNEVNRKLGKKEFDSMASIREEGLKEPIEVATYLYKRLYEIGVRSLHGLPGDYNLVALDYLPKAGVKWVGSVNELNAGYAADGYARVKGVSAIMTTFGVGELSAINALAGAYSEHIPVVHIVGCPSTVSQRNGMLLHHTLGNGDFNVFANMSSQISCNMAKLNNPAEIATQIDYALQQCYIQSRPVYIMLPTDMVEKKIEGARLKTPIDLEEAPNDPEKEDYVVDVVLKYLHAAKKPVMLVDACAIRHRVLDETHALLEKSGIPVFVTPMGKSAINETHSNYGGVYAGEASRPEVKEKIESADLILSIGTLKSDFNTAGFSYRTSQLNTIDFHSTHTVVRYSEYPGVKMRGVLRKVTEKLDLSKLSVIPSPDAPVALPTKEEDSSQTITQAWLWPRVGHFLRKNDIVVTETGTANFGIWDTAFPSGVTALSQVLWGSIGWSVGACQGAALASKDAQTDRRTILFVGDGSFQLTAQEVTTMIRHQLRVTIFVICNDGYTIERFIHGMDAGYNDVVQWKYQDTVTVFGGTDKTAKKFQVRTKEELDKLFKDESFNNAKEVQFVELYMEKKDAPRALIMTAEASAKTNSKDS